jgi:hypothetical protein
MYLVIAVAFLSAFAQTVAGQTPTRPRVSNDDVVQMVKAGLGESVVIAKIRSSEAAFQMEPKDLIALRASGVPDSVIEAMLNATTKPAATAPIPPMPPPPADTKHPTVLSLSRTVEGRAGWPAPSSILVATEDSVDGSRAADCLASALKERGLYEMVDSGEEHPDTQLRITLSIPSASSRVLWGKVPVGKAVLVAPDGSRLWQGESKFRRSTTAWGAAMDIGCHLGSGLAEKLTEDLRLEPKR